MNAAIKKAATRAVGAAALVGAISFAAVPASAAIVLVADTGSGLTPIAFDLVGNNGPIFFDGIQDDFRVVFSGGVSNSPGFDPQSFLTNSAIEVQNLGASTASITLALSAQDFTFPAVSTEVALASSANGTMITQGGAGTSVSFQTFVDFNNILFDGSVGSLSSGPLGPLDIDSVISGLSWGPLESVVTGDITATPFSLTTLVTFTLAAGEALNFNATASISRVPEPMALTLLGLGLVGLGLGRKAKR